MQGAGAAGVIVANNDITGFFKSKDNNNSESWLFCFFGFVLFCFSSMQMSYLMMFLRVCVPSQQKPPVSRFTLVNLRVCETETNTRRPVQSDDDNMIIISACGLVLAIFYVGQRRGDDGGVDGDDGEGGIFIPSASMPLSSASKLRALLDAVADRRMTTRRLMKQQQKRQQKNNDDNDAAAADDYEGEEEEEEEEEEGLQRLRYVSVRFGPARVSSRRVDHIASFSSFGPTEDGRIKPDIVAPGEITSASGAAALNDNVDNFFSGSGGSSGGGNWIGNNQDQDWEECRVVQISGTSMATPVVAGAATLVRQYFVDGFYPSGAKRASDGFSPTAALVKAALINGKVSIVRERCDTRYRSSNSVYSFKQASSSHLSSCGGQKKYKKIIEHDCE